ncbi:unnamed protein product [Brassica oleracea]|uniref:(rape) hypothetical protein n=1 Tax=Brassica napus TaxID=3708 RepID=A0A816RR70_BRANA|nr:unnamed protein product [Brassica napus]
MVIGGERLRCNWTKLVNPCHVSEIFTFIFIFFASSRRRRAATISLYNIIILCIVIYII